MRGALLRLLLALGIWGSLAAACAADKRVALIIGNSAYRHTGELANPRNDAADMAAALKKLDFEVIEAQDLDKAAMDRTIRQFAKALDGAHVGLFFYAGHGLQVEGRNYLVPIDAKLEHPSGLDFEMVRVDLVHRTMERATSTNLIFLDACRDNPLSRNLRRALGTRSASIGRGLAPVESGEGTLISFSTQPGNVAIDGTGRNSPYAAALLTQLADPKDDLSSILIRVRNQVILGTARRQVPWEHSALTAQFYFAAPKARDLGQEMELAFWNTVKDSQTPSIVRTYLARYPRGTFATLAQALIARLEKEDEAMRAAREEEQKRVQAEQKRLDEARKASELERLEEQSEEKRDGRREEELRLAREELRKAREMMEIAEAQRKAAQKAADEARQAAALATKAVEIEARQRTERAKPGQPASACLSHARTAGARVFASEPPRGAGALGYMEKAFVTDNTCPAGQIKEIVGGKRGVRRKVRCVPC